MIPHESQSTSTSTRPDLNDRSTAALLAIALLVPLAIVVISGWLCRLARLPSCDGYVPAALALSVRRFLEGAPLYPDFRKPPYASLLYGPVVPWMAAPLVRLFSRNPIAPLEAGRLLTMISTSIVCLLIFRMARRSGSGTAAAVIASMAFLLSPLLEPWGFEFRVDMTALAFELGGIALFESGLAYPAVVVFVLSFFTKQFRVAGIAAVVLCLWLKGGWRAALRIAAVWIAAVLFMLETLRLVYPYYWLNNYTALAPLYDYWAPPKMLGSLLLAELPLFLLAGAGVLRGWRCRSLTVLFLAAALLQDSLSALRWGSNVSYFLPTLAAAAIVAAPELGNLLQRSIAFGRRGEVIAGAAVAWVIVSQLWLGFRTDSNSAWIPMFWVGVNCECGNLLNQQSLKLLNTIKGPVLTDMSDLALIQAAPQIESLDLLPLAAMRVYGLFDDEPLIRAIQRREYAAIALDWGLLAVSYRGRYWFWPQLGKAIAENYRLIDAYGAPPYVLLPKSGQPE